MAKNGTEFELLVKAIYNEILAYDGYETISVKHDEKIIGRSGQTHQIDVFWEFMVAGVLHKVAVECKEYKSTVSVGKIRDFYGALEDIGNVNGIFVTTKGYQSGAIKYAEYKNISLKTVTEPSHEDIIAHKGINTVNLNINVRCISNTTMTPCLDIDWLLENTSIEEGQDLSFDASNDEVLIIHGNGEMLGSILDYENRLPRDTENEQGLKHTYKFDNAYLHIPGSLYPPLKIIALMCKYDTNSQNHYSVTKYTLLAKAALKDIITGESYLYGKTVEKSYV